MQKFSRKWLRGWARMALFAMLAVLSSPALAFACCCAPEIALVPVPQTPVAATPAPVASHPGCHGHSGADVAKIQNASAGRVSASTSQAAPSVTAASSQPCFKSLCGCGHAQDSALSFVEKQSASSFSPLVLGVSAQRFSPTFTAPSSLCFAFGSNASRPRGPDLAPRSGRGPPVLSF